MKKRIGLTLKEKEDLREEVRILLTTCLECLTEREVAVLKMRFGFQYTLEEVGQRFKVTKERIRQIETKAINKARAYKILKSRGIRNIAIHHLQAITGLSTRAKMCLLANGIYQLYQIIKLSDLDMLKMKNFGPESLLIVKKAIREFEIIEKALRLLEPEESKILGKLFGLDKKTVRINMEFFTK